MSFAKDVEAEFNRLNEQVAIADKNFDMIRDRFEALEKKQGQLLLRYEALDLKLDRAIRLGERAEMLGARVEKLEENNNLVRELRETAEIVRKYHQFELGREAANRESRTLEPLPEVPEQIPGTLANNWFRELRRWANDVRDVLQKERA